MNAVVNEVGATADRAADMSVDPDSGATNNAATAKAATASVISATGVSKRYGKQVAVDNISFEIPSGRIVGLIGPNGSGKTTTLKAVLGLIPFEGHLSVLGLDPRTHRDALMEDVCFIADVAILPRWLRVCDAIDFLAGVHPKFNREKAERYIAHTKLKPTMKVKAMSKGMIVQLHLALVMAIDAKLLVLDEPTLGLDIIYRKQFYQNLLEDYFDEQKTIIITTHQVEEVEHILSDLMFIRDGKIVLSASMEDLGERYVEVMVEPGQMNAANALQPIDKRTVFGKSVMLFDGVPRSQLAVLGETRNPSIADLFVATMKGSYV
jgi:ABC-2 type transport system ATP-binding protein